MMPAIREYIVPEAIALRDKLVQIDQESSWTAAGPVSKKRIILTFDGEHEHLQAMLDLLVDNIPQEWIDQNIELLKYAAATSKYQQPSDTGTCYMVTRALQRAGSHLPPALWADKVSELLHEKLEAASARTFSDLLGRLPDILSRAFTSPNIKDGWQTAGVYPVDIEKIMFRCTTWKAFSNEQGQAILSAITKLIPKAKLTGEISDAQLQEAVGDAVDFEEWMLTHWEHYSTPKTPLEDLVLNRRRAVWVNHGAVTQARQDREVARAEAERVQRVEAEQRTIAKLEKMREKEEKKRKKEEAKIEREAKKCKKDEETVRKAAARQKKEKQSARSGRRVSAPARYKK